MHDEKRPLSEFYYVRNPRRKVYWTEDSRAYWHFDPAYYAESRITPLPSEDPELVGTDWVQFSVDLARRRGMKAGVELSHTWVDKARLKEQFSDCLQRDINGNAFPTPLCVNHPDTRAFARALFSRAGRALRAGFHPDLLSGLQPARPLTGRKSSEVERLIRLPLGACFCDHCRAEAEAQGLPWDAIVDRLRWMADGPQSLQPQAGL